MKRFSLRLWSFLLAMLMVLSLVPMAVMASEEQNDDVIVLTTEGGGTITIIRSNTQTEEKEDVLTVAEPKEYQAGDGEVEIVVTGLSGTGIATDPFLISNIKELEWFRDDVNAGNNYSGKYVKLTADINLNNAEWTPIGYMGKTFVGNFDGGDHTIKNLTITKTLDNSGNSFGDATMTVKGGEIKSTYTGIRMRMADPSLNGNPGNGTVTLNVVGGTIEGTKRGVWGQITNASADDLGTLAITGGTVVGGTDAIRMDTDTYDNIDVAISGDASIKGNLAGDAADYAVSGGTFTVAVPEDFCAEGFIPEENEDGTYGVKVGASVYGSTVNLGSALGMKFFVEKNVLLAVMAANGDETLEGYYAVITRTYADGTTDTQTVTNWIEYDYSGKETMPLYVFGYGNINAKEMIDMMSFQVFDAEGNAITEVYTDSIQAFTMRSVAHEEAKASPSASLLKLLVDMLNYGAAAQTYETYAVDNLANSKLTEAQKAYGTASETAVPDDNDQILSVTGATEYYHGDTLNLGTDIRMKIFFQDLTPEQLASISAKVTFTNHEGEAYELTYAASDFAKYGDTDYYVIGIDKLVAADANTVVTCVVMIDGETTLTIENSINDYLYRAYSYDTENQSIYHAVYYYCDSANAYFHPTTTAAE